MMFLPFSSPIIRMLGHSVLSWIIGLTVEIIVQNLPVITSSFLSLSLSTISQVSTAALNRRRCRKFSVPYNINHNNLVFWLSALPWPPQTLEMSYQTCYLHWSSNTSHRGWIFFVNTPRYLLYPLLWHYIASVTSQWSTLFRGWKRTLLSPNSIPIMSDHDAVARLMAGLPARSV